jgi:hypothetical protein
MSNYRLTFIIALLLLFACAAAAAAAAPHARAAAHTFHTSLMSMEYNSQEQLVEISLQVFSHDLENILTRRNGRKVRIDKTPDATTLILAYLQDTVNLKNGAGETKSLSWVGMETKADRVWLYFETKMPEGLSGAQLRNRIFFDLLDNQINLVHLKDANKKTDLVFKPGDNFKPLFEAANIEKP